MSEENVQVVSEPLINSREFKGGPFTLAQQMHGYVKMNSLPCFRKHRVGCLQILLAYVAIISDSLAWTWNRWKIMKLTWLTDMIEDNGKDDGAASAIKNWDDLHAKPEIFVLLNSVGEPLALHNFLKSNLTLATECMLYLTIGWYRPMSTIQGGGINPCMRRGLKCMCKQKKGGMHIFSSTCNCPAWRMRDFWMSTYCNSILRFSPDYLPFAKIIGEPQLGFHNYLRL